jgi:hypothetical protein
VIGYALCLIMYLPRHVSNIIIVANVKLKAYPNGLCMFGATNSVLSIIVATNIRLNTF